MGNVEQVLLRSPTTEQEKRLGFSIKALSSGKYLSARQRGVAKWKPIYLGELLSYSSFRGQVASSNQRLQPGGLGDYIIRPLPIDLPGVVESSN